MKDSPLNRKKIVPDIPICMLTISLVTLYFEFIVKINYFL